jgi:GTP pyrophosphokinase
MHEESELGVCAHWHYKQGGKLGQEGSYEQKIAWLRQVLDWHEELGDLTALADQLNREIHQERIYVFTPDGHVVDLQSGATPLDFAYSVHTQIGHRCRGAKVNGRIVPLTYQLKTGEQVEILTTNHGEPSRDWLVPSLGYLKTSKARSKVQHWFKQQDRDHNVASGRSILEKEFNRLAIKMLDLDMLAQQVNLKGEEDLYAALGAGDVRLAHVLTAAQKLLGPPSEPEPQLNLTLHQRDEVIASSDVVIRGVGNLLTHMAGCCQPVPGDAIIGYITVGRGVTVHKQDCSNIAHMQEAATQRLIEVSWGEKVTHTYPVHVILTAYDRPGLLKDITLTLSNERVDVSSVNMTSNKNEGTIQMHLTLDVSGLDALGKVLDKLHQLPNVMDVARHRDA